MNKNPFTETLVVNYIRWIKRDAPYDEDKLREADWYDVEQTKSSRVYRHKDHFYYLMTELGNSGMKLFLYILYHFTDNSTSIKLDEVKLAKEVFKCSERQVYRMKSELIKAAIIAKQDGNRFWVNPKFISSGSRLELFPECAVKVVTKREEFDGFRQLTEG